MKHRKHRIGKLALIFSIVFCSLTLSGLGYPNDSTVIIGPDMREGAAPLYDIKLEIPETISQSGELTARLSFESTDNYIATAEATLNVAGGTLRNEQTQKLSPDVVWKIQGTSASLVGLVVSVQTKMHPKDRPESETIYLDTISGSVVVAGTQDSVRPSNNNATAEAFEVDRTKYLWMSIPILFVVIVMGVIFLRKKH